eukprot:jgi/Ulvmu1/7179/UM034_0088.1
MGIRGDPRLNQGLNDWQHKPIAMNRGVYRSKMYLTFEDLGIPDLIVQGMSKEGMRTAQPEQASVITPILCRQNALVICPEAAEPLYFLRSSICAASLTLSANSVSAVQAVLLTPTENLARALYRPLEGYARFASLGARICSGPNGSFTPPSSPSPGSVHSSPPSARGDGGLSTRGRTRPQILVGTPETVLAHLCSDSAPVLAPSMLMVVCHAHDIFDGCACERQLAAVTQRTRPSQVVVVASQESRVAPQCDKLFPHLTRLYPYATARAASFDGSAASRVASQRSSGRHGNMHGGQRNSGEGRASPEVPRSPPGWAGSGRPWVPMPTSSSAGELQRESSIPGHADMHFSHSLGSFAGSKGASAHGIPTEGTPVKRNMHKTILPAGYMPCKPQLNGTPSRSLPQTQPRHRVKASATDWVPGSHCGGGCQGQEPCLTGQQLPGAWWHCESRAGHGCSADVGGVDGPDQMSEGAAAAQPVQSAATLRTGSAPVQNATGQHSLHVGRVDAGPFPTFDDEAGASSADAPAWRQPRMKGHGFDGMWSRRASLDDAALKTPSAKSKSQPQASKGAGKTTGQLTHPAVSRPADCARLSSAQSQPDRQAKPAQPAGAPEGECLAREASEAAPATAGWGEETPTLAVTSKEASAGPDVAYASQGSGTTGRSSSVSFTAWTPAAVAPPTAAAAGMPAVVAPATSAAAPTKPLPPNLGQHPWPLTMVTGTRDAAPPPPLRQCAVPVPSMREVEQLSAAVRRTLSLQRAADHTEPSVAAEPVTATCGENHSKRECNEVKAEKTVRGTKPQGSQPPGSATLHSTAVLSTQAPHHTAALRQARAVHSVTASASLAIAAVAGRSVPEGGDAAESRGTPAASAHLPTASDASHSMVRSLCGGQQEAAPEATHHTVAKKALSPAAIAQAREAAAEAIFAADRASKAPCAATEPSSANVSREVSTVLSGVCIGSGQLQLQADAAARDARLKLDAYNVCNTRGAKEGKASQPAMQQTTQPHAAAASSLDARTAWGSTTVRPPMGRGGGFVVSTPPHFKILPFCNHRGPSDCSKQMDRSKQSLQAPAAPHVADLSAACLIPIAQGANDDVGPGEATDKEHQALLRTSSEEQSDYTVMAYAGSSHTGVAPPESGNGRHSGDDCASIGGVVRMSASPPLLELCQGNSLACDAGSGISRNQWAMEDRAKPPVQTAHPDTMKGKRPTEAAAPLTLLHQEPVCSLRHEAMVMRQLPGTIAPPPASPAAISLVTAALERMAASDHTAVHTRRPAADSYSRYEQACAALVAAPEAPASQRCIIHRQEPSTRGPSAVYASDAQPMAATFGAGRSLGAATCGTLAADRESAVQHHTGSEVPAVQAVPEHGLDLQGGDARQECAANSGSTRSTNESCATSGRTSMIGEASRRNYLKLFSQDDLDLAEDLAFSCAAFGEI